MLKLADPPPVLDPDAPLARYWNKPVSDLATIEVSRFSLEQRERHRIYALATMALLSAYWNGNKRGQSGDYPWRKKQRRENGTYAGDRFGDRYLGHNIACVAIDGNGEIIDFDFNHNDIFSSSAEHAEIRLIRRLFSLTQVYDDWAFRKPGSTPPGYGTLLNNVTIVTTLESCAQCSGVMTLGGVGRVIYLHSDPGQYVIGNILYNLTAKPGKAPRPIAANQFGFEYFDKLNQAYADFYKKVQNKPFYIGSDGKEDKSPSITSFLCTDPAKDLYDAAAKELQDIVLTYPDFRPDGPNVNPERVLSNAEALKHVRGFIDYAVSIGRRGTPHK